jgi:hypothetical protein
MSTLKVKHEVETPMSFDRGNRVDHMADKERVVMENDQFVHFVCRKEMIILGLIKNEGIRVECCRCRFKRLLERVALYDMGVRIRKPHV